MKANQAGLSMVEVLIVLAMTALLVVSATVASAGWRARERARSVAYELQTSIQLARSEAVTRNRECRFTIDVAAQRLAVWDGMGTPATTDDRLLQALDLPDGVRFERPDGVDPITLDEPTAGVFQAQLSPAGSVTSGAGDVGLHSGDRYLRLTLAAAGGLRVQRWNGAAWESGQ